MCEIGSLPLANLNAIRIFFSILAHANLNNYDVLKVFITKKLEKKQILTIKDEFFLKNKSKFFSSVT